MIPAHLYRVSKMSCLEKLVHLKFDLCIIMELSCLHVVVQSMQQEIITWGDVWRTLWMHQQFPFQSSNLIRGNFCIAQQEQHLHPVQQCWLVQQLHWTFGRGPGTLGRNPLWYCFSNRCHSGLKVFWIMVHHPAFCHGNGIFGTTFVWYILLRHCLQTQCIIYGMPRKRWWWVWTCIINTLK